MGDHHNYVMKMPPGFHFYPTDEELVVHFLHRKAALFPFHPDVIPDLDLYPYEPWELDGKAVEEGNKWYFYSRRTPSRVTENGYWQPMGMEEPVVTSANKMVGMKKYYVFCIGEAPSGAKTTWIMHEYRLSDNNTSSSSCRSTTSSKRRGPSKTDYSKWVVCQVYRQCDDDHDDGTELSYLDEVYLSLDDPDEINFPN